MNIEQKAKIFLGILVLFFVVLSAVLFLYHQTYFIFSLAVSSVLIILMAVMEAYLRIQHNIDHKMINLYSLDIERKQNKLNKEIIDLLEKIVNKFEANNADTTKKIDLLFEELAKKNSLLFEELAKKNNHPELSELLKHFEELKQLIDSKFYNNRIAQAKLYSALEEMIIKFSDLKQNQA